MPKDLSNVTVSPDDEGYGWTLEKLRRKRDQEWEMAGCARHDHDKEDEINHTYRAKQLELIIREIYH